MIEAETVIIVNENQWMTKKVPNSTVFALLLRTVEFY